MKFTIEQGKLNSALGIVCRVLDDDKKVILQSTGNKNNGKLSICGGSYNQFYEIWINGVNVAESGSFTVDGTKLKKMTDRNPKADLNIIADDNTMSLHTKNYDASLNKMIQSVFLEKQEREDHIELEMGIFKKLLDSVAWASGKFGDNFNLDTVFITFSKDDISVLASDSIVIATNKAKIKTGLKKDVTISLPLTAVKEIQKFGDGPVDIRLAGDSIEVVQTNDSTTTHLISRLYAISSILEKIQTSLSGGVSKTCITFNAKDFEEAIQQTKIFSSTAGFITYIKQGKNKLVIKAEGSEGKFEQSFKQYNVVDSQEVIEMKVNADYLTDALKHCENAELHYEGELKPIWIAEGDYKGLISVVRLKEKNV
ncbi:MAG: hypothetical protein WC476_01340 [Phycisphaerae bacterium]|jgi:DNA polymerase III sliding clamp (beta) subunit (PCNA family)